MRTVTGKPISPGYARGRVFKLSAGHVDVSARRITPTEIDREIARFHSALERSARDLQQLQERIHADIGQSQAEIVAVHLLLLRDRKIIDGVEGLIREDRHGVESAIQATVADLACVLGEAEDEYLRERADDIRDIGRRLIKQVVRGEVGELAHLPPNTVLVARDLLPSDVLELDRRHVVGVVTEVGGEIGHAAILARAMGVPAVTGVPEAARIADPGMLVLLDGQTGEVVFDPSPEKISLAAVFKERYERSLRRTLSSATGQCMTRDGVAIQLCGNIGRPDEVEDVNRHHLDGVGLFRTEYLSLDAVVPPSLEYQRDVYLNIAESLPDRPVVIRTLDFGGDKRPTFLAPQFEENPNLGIRGLRSSLLTARELFRTQIRALLTMGDQPNVRIMLPMVLGGGDLRQAVALIREVADEEDVRELPPLGVLVETPAAVFGIDDILSVADFISIGTNDLTQFILAADRNALSMMDDYTALHPSVLRAIVQVAKAVNTSGKPLSICGEAAGDPRVACLLVGLGVRSLSMSPICAAPVRYALCASRLSTLRKLADAALASDSAEGISAMLNERLRDVLPESISPRPRG